MEIINNSLDERYQKKLKQLILSDIKERIFDFEEICKRAKGAFPSEVKKIIDQIYSASDIEIRSQIKKIYDNILPEPHPVDFEWRFNKKTAKKISEFALSIGSSVACVGTPTIFIELCKQNVKTNLFDKNEIIYKYLRKHFSQEVFLVDILKSSLPLIKYDVIVVDPPWYLEHYQLWLSGIRELCKTHSRIIVTLFPELIRPSAISDRNKIISFLKSFGKITFLKFKAVYETPLFEKESMISTGINPIDNWRTCQLLLIELEDSIPNQNHERIEENTEWIKYQLGSQVIAIKRENNSQSALISASSIYSDGSLILKSVSRRDQDRAKINLWTSRNRCLQIRGIDRLTEYLGIIEEEQSVQAAFRKFEIEPEEMESIILINSAL